MSWFNDPNALPLDVILASLPGVLVALLTYWLTVRHEAALAARGSANERTLLRLEMAHNHAALAAFWQGIQDLAKKKDPDIEYEGLAALASGGLLAQIAPKWSVRRWEHISAEALSRVGEKDLAEIDQTYRTLRTISDLFTQLITMTPEESALLDKDRFWPNRYADWRQGTFDRLSAAVASVLGGRDPLG
jgi:hypothetical protein